MALLLWHIMKCNNNTDTALLHMLTTIKTQVLSPHNHQHIGVTTLQERT
jgi:hypothetical protein